MMSAMMRNGFSAQYRATTTIMDLAGPLEEAPKNSMRVPGPSIFSIRLRNTTANSGKVKIQTWRRRRPDHFD